MLEGLPHYNYWNYLVWKTMLCCLNVKIMTLIQDVQLCIGFKMDGDAMHTRASPSSSLLPVKLCSWAAASSLMFHSWKQAKIWQIQCHTATWKLYSSASHLKIGEQDKLRERIITWYFTPPVATLTRTWSGSCTSEHYEIQDFTRLFPVRIQSRFYGKHKKINQSSGSTTVEFEYCIDDLCAA